jgi:hypothetical protein
VTAFWGAGVYVGANKKLPFTVSNPGEIETVLFFDLSNYPDFALEPPAHGSSHRRCDWEGVG